MGFWNFFVIKMGCASVILIAFGLNTKVEYDNPLSGVIVDIRELVISIDLNHQLAGQALTFEIELLDSN